MEAASQGFLDAYIERIEQTEMPTGDIRSTYKNGAHRITIKLRKITYDQAIDLVATEGFTMLSPVFKQLAQTKH